MKIIKSTEMKSSTERDGQKIEFDLALAASFKQLVNNAHMADIRFKVGQSGELIFAHKHNITVASEVFYAQFYGGFAESQRDTLTDPVVVEDIEPGPFLELLQYIYCREVNIQPDNLLDIYYASEKYMLRSLGMICEENFYRQINETTVLKIFQHNRRYEFPAIDTVCLEIICDNPLHYFKQEEFLTLNQQAVQLIAASNAMNCRIDQLEQAIEQWKQNIFVVAIEVELQKFLCRKLYIYGDCSYSSNVDTRFVLDAGTNGSIGLYGLGIYVGVENDSPKPKSTVTISVDLKGFSVKETFPILDELKIYEITFEKQLIDEPCEISVKVVQEGRANKMFHLNGWTTMDDTMLKVKGWIADNQYYRSGQRSCGYCGYINNNCSYCRTPQMNCVAYLLCSRKKQKRTRLGNS